MRIWYVDPSELDNQRLLAAHHEFHGIHTLVVVQGRKWKGWEKLEYRYAFMEVHEKLEYEMLLRGYKSVTPLQLVTPLTDEEFLAQREFPVTPEMLLSDRWTLLCRWDGEFRGRAHAPESELAWFELIAKYQEQGGCVHDGPTEVVEGGALCLLCKRYVRRRGSDVWLPKRR
jgi:hypothetical protein